MVHLRHRGRKTASRKTMKAPRGGNPPDNFGSKLPPVADTLMMLLHSATNAHIQHLQTRSFSAHMALGAYYPKIVDLVDGLIEMMQGMDNQIITGYPLANNGFSESMAPLDYLMSIRDQFQAGRSSFPSATPVQNLLDGISELIDSTIYKLQFLA